MKHKLFVVFTVSPSHVVKIASGCLKMLRRLKSAENGVFKFLNPRRTANTFTQIKISQKKFSLWFLFPAIPFENKYTKY